MHSMKKLPAQPVLVALVSTLLVMGALVIAHHMFGQQEQTNSHSVVSKTVHQEHPLKEYRVTATNFHSFTRGT